MSPAAFAETFEPAEESAVGRRKNAAESSSGGGTVGGGDESKALTLNHLLPSDFSLAKYAKASKT